MKFLACIALLAVSFVVSIPFCLAQNSQVSTTSSAPQGNINLPQTFTSSECDFTIGLPGTPSSERHPFKSKDGQEQLYSYLFTWATNLGVFSVRCTDTTTAVGDPVYSRNALNSLRDLLVSKNTALNLARDADISAEGYPGREIFLEDADGILIQRFYLVGQRAFDLHVYLPKALRSKQSEAIKILDSFKPLRSSEEELGEVDKLLMALKGKENVYGACPKDDPLCKPVPGALTGGAVNKQAVNLPQPSYPPVAKAARIKGVVEVKVVLDETGKVIAAQAISGHPLLQAAAVSAARQAQFAPTLLDGKPVKVVGVISYNFML